MRTATFRNIIILICLSMGIIPVYAQRDTLSERETIENALREERRQIKFAADVRDYASIRLIRKQLKAAFEGKRQLAFTEEEELMIDYMIGDYEDVLNRVKEWPRSSISRYDPGYPPDDGLLGHLLDVAVLDSVQLLNMIDQSQFSGYEQAFLKLYLRTLLSLNTSSDISRKDLQESGQAYLDEFAPTPFDRFVKLRIRRKYVRNKWGATIGLGVARGTFQGSFGELVRYHVPVLIDLEVNYKKMIAGVRLSVGEGTVRQDFEYDGFWDRGLKVNPFYGGLYVGYMLDAAPFRIIPYYDIGGTVITIAEQDLTVDNEEQDIGAFTHGPGLSLDFLPPFSWSGFDNEVYKLGLRFKGGILFNNLKNKSPMFESTYPYVGVSLIMDFVGTELDVK